MNGPTDPKWFCQIGFSGEKKFQNGTEAKEILMKSIPRHSKLLHYISDVEMEKFAKQACMSTGRAKKCSSFYSGRTVLLGDAGWPFPPVGQGVNAAMEMAVELDKALSRNVPAAAPVASSESSKESLFSDGVTRALLAFSKTWTPEAEAVSTISFHGLDLRRFGKGFNLRFSIMLILEKLFGQNAMQNAKREDMTYSQALAYEKRVNFILSSIGSLLVVTTPVVIGLFLRKKHYLPR